jgi:hypothetical protein
MTSRKVLWENEGVSIVEVNGGREMRENLSNEHVELPD